MRRLIVLTLALFLLAPPAQAFAHAVGQVQDLPVPFWLYLFGASAVVVISFVQVILFVGEGHTLQRYPRLNLLSIDPVRAVLTSKALLLGVRLLSVALFLLVILSGLLGQQVADQNFAPIFVWIVWWVGFSFFTAFVGNLWPLVNPWKILFEWADQLARRLGVEQGIEIGEPYPASWEVWPALAFYAAFVWIETAFTGSSTPYIIALFILLYSMNTWTGMVLFGKDAWLPRGEMFSVFFGILGKFAPTEVRVSDPKLCEECSGDCPTVQGECVYCYECFARATPEERQLNLRPWAVGLTFTEEVTLDRLVFVIFVLASVAYHSLVETQLWAELFTNIFISRTVTLLALPLVFLAVYLGVMKLSQIFTGISLGFGKPGQLFGRDYAPFREYIPVRRLAAAYVYTLVPIAIAYQVAHYYTYLLIQGRTIIRLLSDPFGWEWNLLGTAGYKIPTGSFDPTFVWYSQIAVIVAGHVVAIYLAHVVALRLLKNPVLAVRSQYPMLGLMVIYTIFSLWLLSQ
jgi:hypothetical protein